MNINTIKTDIEKTEKLISIVKQLIEDYESAKNEVTKKILEQAITKYSASFSSDKSD